MTPRKVLALAALALAGVHVAWAGRLAVAGAAARLREAAHHRGEDPAAARGRVFGAAYVAAIEEIRRAVPPDGVYLLVDAQESEEGGLFWVRFDLAPRRALLLGHRDELTSPVELRRRRQRGAQLAVIVHSGGQPPELLHRSALWRRLAAGRR
jgi:hypothetical protein